MRLRERFRRASAEPAVNGRSATVLEDDDRSHDGGEFAAPGDRIAGYLVEAPLGRGGMGVVYRAFHMHLARPVALKLLPPELSEDDRFRTRFVRESRTAASLLHPNIVTIFDAGEERGRLYIAMQLITGGDLGAEIAESGTLTAERTARMLQQVGSALDTAHAAGLVHRDVKPANVLIEGEQFHLGDFGLSKRLRSQSGLTKLGQVVGTLDYLAPEQIEGAGAGARSDQYALACMAYECLTGHAPYADRAEDVAVLNAHLREPLPKVGSAGLGGAVDEVLARATSKDPAGRYATCSAFAADFARAVGATPAEPAAAAPERTEAVAGVLLVGHDAAAVAAIRSALAVGGFRVAEAEAGGAAVEAARSLAPSLIVADWTSLDSDTREALGQVAPQARLVAVVDRADSTDRRGLLDQGAHEVLTRPVSPVRVLALVRVMLGDGSPS